MLSYFIFFFFNDTATTEIYTLSLHDALPISPTGAAPPGRWPRRWRPRTSRSEEHTSELQSHSDLVCRLLLEKKKKNIDSRFFYLRNGYLRDAQDYADKRILLFAEKACCCS